ncbi:CpsD/CapB family tyrosine-protein kinase [Fictibacillus enclensis]|uniref:CpsD/CapB family tyrosine-protein kinase n=1 Tax=Fictibacillus enclensis TaxID=1017270 RepID=UPI0024BF6C15|nr:CpsD/CapB family tyrosine-protein kinase [Fictibacillus enclensis]WHY71048.1 CpsD/CapB family tyrosine-protein kinase [Fictibacillus enclensis]
MLNKKRKNTVNQKRNLVAFSHPHSVASEQYRTIRTNIHFLTKENRKKVFVVTSPGKGEGKSTTAANLAVSIAQHKEKVLLIDANLRDPSLHVIFKMNNEDGLSTILNGSSPTSKSVQSTEIGRLDVVTSGPLPLSSAELLSSNFLKDFLYSMYDKYDVILVDTPPVLDITDTQLIAEHSDGIILVMRRGVTKKAKVHETQSVLELSKAPILGAVVNR